MSLTILVVDTNVVVAGLLTKNPASASARVLDGMLSAGFAFALSEELLGEYRTVLLRPAIRRRHGLSVEEIESLLTDLAQRAIVLTPDAATAFTRRPSSAPMAPDAGDQFLWNLLAMHPDLVLISGDHRLVGDPAMHGRVRTPRQILDGD